MKFGPNGELPPEIWDMPLVHFAAMVGVQLTPAHAILLGGWLRRHNAKILDRCTELAEREAQKRRDTISRN